MESEFEQGLKLALAKMGLEAKAKAEIESDALLALPPQPKLSKTELLACQVVDANARSNKRSSYGGFSDAYSSIEAKRATARKNSISVKDFMAQTNT